MGIYDYVIIGTGLSSLGILEKINNSKKKKKILILETPNKKLQKNFKNPIYCEENIPIPISKQLSSQKTFLKLLNYKSMGGNTNFWGGYCYRFLNEDIKDWPISINELEKSYVEAEKILRPKAKKIKYPFDKKNKNYVLESSSIAQKKGRVFNAGDIILDIIKKKKISIFYNELDFFEKKGKLYILHLIKSEKLIFCKKLIICAGTFSTASIIKKSIPHIKLRKIKQAQSFVIPILLKKKIKNNIDLQIILKSFTKFGEMYLELKKNNLLIKKSIKKNFKGLVDFIPNFVLDNLAVIWGFIPSKYSHDYEIINNKKIINKQNRIRAKITRTYLNELVNILKKNLDLIVIKKFIRINQFARSYHVGCNIPMSIKKKKYLTTNLYGELNLKKYKGIFICGSSLFESLPSKSHGLTILANSLRIGDHLKYDYKN